MTTYTIGMSYSDRMQRFVTDPKLQSLDLKYEPYLEIHEMDDVVVGFDITQISTETRTMVNLFGIPNMICQLN